MAVILRDIMERKSAFKMSRPESALQGRDTFLVFGAPLIGDDEIEEVVDSLKSGWLGTGPKVARFEKDFGSYIGAANAVAVNSCTAALHLSILAAGIEPGDEVITSALTFCATVNAIIHAGATPVIVDVDPLTMNVDPEQVRARLTPRTRALIPVHFAGRPCDMEALCEIAAGRDLTLIEDCAHAIETEYKGRKAGTFGDFGCFSFYVTKNVVTGEGGMVATKNPDLISRVKVLSLHGLSTDAWARFSDSGYKHYGVTEAGFKYNMMDIQAALGLGQMARLEDNSKKREKVWQAYQGALGDLPLFLPVADQPDTRHARHLFTILADTDRLTVDRDFLLGALYAEGIGSGVHYIALHSHKFYQDTLGCRIGDFPNAEFISDRTLSIPLSASMSNRDTEDVIAAVKKVFTWYAK